MKKVEHIGIAVKNLSSANDLFAKLFNQDNYKVESVESEEVTHFFFNLEKPRLNCYKLHTPILPLQSSLIKEGGDTSHRF